MKRANLRHESKSKLTTIRRGGIWIASVDGGNRMSLCFEAPPQSRTVQALDMTDLALRLGKIPTEAQQF